MTEQENEDRTWQRCRGWEGAVFESGEELSGNEGQGCHKSDAVE